MGLLLLNMFEIEQEQFCLKAKFETGGEVGQFWPTL